MVPVKQALSLSAQVACVAAGMTLVAVGCNGQISDAQGGAGTGASTGAGGDAALVACKAQNDPRVVVAPRRLVRLTRTEVVNTVRALINDEAASAILAKPDFSTISDETTMRFPPLSSQGEARTISGDPDSFPTFSRIGEQVSQYVYDHYATITGCASMTDDACAQNYLKSLAAKAYRRPLSSGEQTRLTGLFGRLKSQTLNGVTITATTQEAVQYAVNALFVSPQMLWRSEVGDPSKPSSAPPGVPLTDYELASALSFFLTDSPPDDVLLGMAGTPGMLRANLAAQTTRLLATPAAKAWLSHLMLLYYRINLLYNARIGPNFPEATTQLESNMHDEAQKFIDHTIWNLGLKDLLTSRTTFLNSTLATTIYMVPVPDGASQTAFVQADLPADQRAGILTNAAYITSRAGSDRESVVQRALLIKDTLLCLTTPPPPESIAAAVAAAKSKFEQQTAQQQVEARRMNPICNSCHGNFDTYGLVLDSFDNIARSRTMVTIKDANGADIAAPVDTHATLPPTLGGGPVMNAVDLAQKLADSDLFANCMARNILQYAMSEFETSNVDLPTPPDVYPGTAGCAALDVANRYKKASGQTFSDLLRATVSSPAFALRLKE